MPYWNSARNSVFDPSGLVFVCLKTRSIWLHTEKRAYPPDSLVNKGWNQHTAVLNFCIFNGPKKNSNSTNFIQRFLGRYCQIEPLQLVGQADSDSDSGTHLTLKLSQYSKSGSRFFSSKPMAASRDCSWLGNTLCLCLPVRQSNQPKLCQSTPRALPLILQSRPSIVPWNSVLEWWPDALQGLELGLKLELCSLSLSLSGLKLKLCKSTILAYLVWPWYSTWAIWQLQSCTQIIGSRLQNVRSHTPFFLGRSLWT